ncbi:protein of unknown function [Streptococcus thermophilus]|nr:protein of unknown function [Streptococcus thermophilus]
MLDNLKHFGEFVIFLGKLINKTGYLVSQFNLFSIILILVNVCLE